MCLDNKQHVVIAAVPLVDSLHAPMAAPAVLKASLSRAGIASTALDLNIEVLLKIKSHPDAATLTLFFDSQHTEDWTVHEISKILLHCANRIVSFNPTVIALSLLTYQCQNFTLWLCLVLRQVCPEARIVIGGPGIKNMVANFDDTFRDLALSKGLIDHYITGDGDQALIEYVKNNYDYPGINTDHWTPIADLDELPYPDWSDYNFYLYSQTYLPLVDAKGCVRNCEFCDVIEYWQKFKSRKAENIFSEMLHQINRYGYRDFDFRSSLSNGNLKEFKRLLAMMYEYNQSRSYRVEQISWNASFIVRQKSQHDELMWQQMGATHATLSIGVESLVESVRHGLGKHFDNKDIDWHLEMAATYNVKIILMIITGYPTETHEDWEFTKQWFRDRKHYNKIVSRLFLSPAAILPGTALHRNMDVHRITWIGPTLTSWQTNNIDKTQRDRYQTELQTVCKNLGFNLDAY